MIVLFIILSIIAVVILICIILGTDDFQEGAIAGALLTAVCAGILGVGMSIRHDKPEYTTVEDVNVIKVDTTFITTRMDGVTKTDTIYTINYK